MNIKKRIIVGITLIALIAGLGLSCEVGDRWNEDLFLDDLYALRLTVGENFSEIPLDAGGAYFDASTLVRTVHGGVGMIAIGHNATVPLHEGIGSFDLTGGIYDNQFTATANVFEPEDAELSNWIVIGAGTYQNTVAEIDIYIDAQNVVLHTMNWNWDLTNETFYITPHPIFASCAAGHVHIDGKSVGDLHLHSYEHTGECLFLAELEAGVDDISNLCIQTDASGYESVEAIDVEYDTGDLQPGDHTSIVRVILDETDAIASDATTEIDFLNFLTTDNSTSEKHAIHISQSFDSAMTVSGGLEEDPDHGYQVTLANVPTDRVTGIAPDGTAFLDASASNELIFGADGDYILIGSDATFEAIDAILVSGANQPILAEYYYSLAGGLWVALTVSETTNGFTQSGTITFEAPAAWALTNVVVPAGAAINNAYYIKIVRTRNNLGAPPVEDYFKTFTTSSTTDFEVRGDGTIRPVEMADASAPNNSLYYSLTQNKLVYKDNGGVVHDLW